MSPARQDSKRKSGSDGGSSEDEGAAVLPLRPTRYSISSCTVWWILMSLVTLNLNECAYDQCVSLSPPTSAWRCICASILNEQRYFLTDFVMSYVYPNVRSQTLSIVLKRLARSPHLISLKTLSLLTWIVISACSTSDCATKLTKQRACGSTLWIWICKKQNKTNIA